jgi:hypothetical protein
LARKLSAVNHWGASRAIRIRELETFDLRDVNASAKLANKRSIARLQLTDVAQSLQRELSGETISR